MNLLIIAITMTTMMIGVIANSETQKVLAENKVKEYCSDYGGEWGNDKCKIEDKEDKSDYEDTYAMNPKILKSIKNM